MTPRSLPLSSDPVPVAIPPNNVEAEAAVLGSVLLDRETVGRVSALLTPDDFYDLKHTTIYRAMLALDERGEPVDYLTIVTELDRTGLLETVGAGAVGELIGVVPTPIHAERYAKLVADAALHRRLISAGGRIATIGYRASEEPEVSLARAEQVLADVAGTAPLADFVSIADGLSLYLDQLVDATSPQASETPIARRLPTTYRDLDRLLGGGLARGDLVLLAGRPGTGKSSLATEIVSRLALTYAASIAIFSLEMGVSQVLARMVASTSGIPLDRLADGKLSAAQQQVLGATLGKLAEADVVIDESASLSIAQVRSKIRRLAIRRSVDLVVVDHMQLLTGRGENRVAEMGDISRSLKAMARDHNVVVLALSQLSRAVEQRADKEPVLSDLRESGSLEQDADLVLMLYREEMYDRATERAGIADLIVPKHRNGRTGRVSLIWNPETTAFRGLEAYDAG